MRDIIDTLSVTSAKTSAYVKGYDGETKWVYFLIENNEYLKNYNDIWNKVTTSIKTEFDSKPIYNTKFLKTKIKSL